VKFHTFIAIVIMALAPNLFAQRIVINEIMYAPKSPEPEWIELFNSSDSTVSTIGWTISNHLRTYTLNPNSIAPHGYLILTKDSANFLRVKYSIPNANILETKMPPFGNTGDTISIKDSIGNIIDMLAYSPKWGGADSLSLERIDYEAATDSLNFGSCIFAIGATPGKENSIRRRDYDLAIESLSCSKINQNDLSFTATIVNKGRKEITEGIITLASKSGLPFASSQLASSIAPLGKQDVGLTWQNADYGRSSITAIVNETHEERHSNDTLASSCYLPIPRSAIVINEIMPIPKDGSCQWIELYNNSPSIANLDSTALLIGVGTKFYRFVINSFSLDKDQYGVVSADSSFYFTYPYLNNSDRVAILNKADLKLKDSGNVIMLVNSDSSLIDSLHFYPSWYLPNSTQSGVSLERKIFSAPSSDASNWSSSFSQQGATPLTVNSDVLDSSAVSAVINIQISPNPISPDGDGFDDATNITVQIPGDEPTVISAKLYDLRGRLKRIISEGQAIYRTVNLASDGKDDNGKVLPSGLYTLVVESASGLFKPQSSGLVIMKKTK
jgi:hypothetical protein